ncbi:hypothetical protein CcI156_12760 [Frankia sp. CcI156]|nr:hypothetical protein Manayef4_19385 [Frankia sp. CgIM4]ONH25573.1 hypothetical protein CcI156_12760 [Frankia sp. CcI156]
MAETRCDTGLTLVKVSSQPGSVFAGTNALDRKVSGNRIIIEIPCTLRALRATVPIQVNAHAIAQPVRTASTIAPSTPGTPPPGR